MPKYGAWPSYIKQPHIYLFFCVLCDETVKVAPFVRQTASGSSDSPLLTQTYLTYQHLNIQVISEEVTTVIYKRFV